MCANSTSHAQEFLSASDAAVSQEVADGKISIQSACALNTRYMLISQTMSSQLRCCGNLNSNIYIIP
jgi:hypothetical protein